MPELERLIEHCLKKDNRAEYQLYRHCFPVLMRICTRYTRNDDDAAALLNLGFLKILNHLNDFKNDLSFEKWIKTIMINTVIDGFKSDKKRKALFTDVALEEVPGTLHPVDWNEAEHQLGMKELLNEIRALPEPAQTVFNLFVFDGFSHREIGEALHIPESTSRWYLANARKTLQLRISALTGVTKTIVV